MDCWEYCRRCLCLCHSPTDRPTDRPRRHLSRVDWLMVTCILLFPRLFFITTYSSIHNDVEKLAGSSFILSIYNSSRRRRRRSKKCFIREMAGHKATRGASKEGRKEGREWWPRIPGGGLSSTLCGHIQVSLFFFSIHLLAMNCSVGLSVCWKELDNNLSKCSHWWIIRPNTHTQLQHYPTLTQPNLHNKSISIFNGRLLNEKSKSIWIELQFI